MNITNNKQLADAMRTAKQFLATNREERNDITKVAYICIAIQLAHQHKLIAEHIGKALVKEVIRRIDGRVTLASYLDGIGQLPNSARAPGGYDLMDPEYLAIRDWMVADIIKAYEEQS